MAHTTDTNDTIERIAGRIVDMTRLCLTRDRAQVVPVLDAMLDETKPVIAQMRDVAATMLIGITELDEDGATEVIVTDRAGLAGVVFTFLMELENRVNELIRDHLKETQ